mgnify:CR=1 FL=1
MTTDPSQWDLSVMQERTLQAIIKHGDLRLAVEALGVHRSTVKTHVQLASKKMGLPRTTTLGAALAYQEWKLTRRRTAEGTV